MATQYPANHVTLSSGSVLFSDPTKPWDPENFPDLPSTLLSLTASGRIEDGNLSTITFPNTIQYEPFEPAAIRPGLKKTFEIAQDGLVSFEEVKMGYVSTGLAAFSTSVTAFQPYTIGAPNIKDIQSGDPDTVTNAIAKLDAWIATAFLLQPPAVQPIEAEVNSIYGGMRWLNYRAYDVFDRSVPYVNAIQMIVGDPATANYCVVTTKTTKYFPLGAYTNGITPNTPAVNSPLVRIRIFTDCFLTSATTFFTKMGLQSPTSIFQLVSESGTATFPATGNVLAVEDTTGSTYTTVSLYLPNLAASYPKGTNIPVRLIYRNNSLGVINVAVTSVQIAATGEPSPPTAVAQSTATQSTLFTRIDRPVYCDVSGAVSTPYLSSYRVSYTLKEYATALNGVGFRYGSSNVTDFPTTLSNYNGVTFTTATRYLTSSQILRIDNLVPGAVWSTSAVATNCARGTGQPVAGQFMSTLFPSQRTPLLSTVSVVPVNTNQMRISSLGFLRTPNYAAASGWSVSNAPSYDVQFLSTVAPFAYKLSTVVQFNDVSYPGDRGTFTVTPRLLNMGSYKDSVSLAIAPVNNDFDTMTPYTAAANANTVGVQLSDSQTSSNYQKFFYNADISGVVTISSLVSIPHGVTVAFNQRRIQGGAVVSVTPSTPVYMFLTDAMAAASTVDIRFNNVVTSTTQVCGILTPTPQSKFLFDLYGSNFAYNYIGSSIGTAQITFDGAAASQTYVYSTGVRIYNGATQVTATPFPLDTLLRLSSCSVSIDSNIYQITFDRRNVAIRGSLTPANPVTPNIPFVSTLADNLFIDIPSVNALSSLRSTTSALGMRVLSLVPRLEQPGLVNNINDGVNAQGVTDAGLNVAVSSFYTVTQPSTISVSSFVLYQHTSSLTEAFPSPYSRELLFSGGLFQHPAGYNFGVFDGTYLGRPDLTYPNFVGDLDDDANNGYRYATFAYEFPAAAIAQPYRYLYVRIKSPSPVPGAGSKWPCDPVPPQLMNTLQLRMHAKLIGVYDAGETYTYESAWVNCLKQLDARNFRDDVYDIGAGLASDISGGDVVYKVQFNRRYYTKMMVLVRVGISRLEGRVNDAPFRFAGCVATMSDD